MQIITKTKCRKGKLLLKKEIKRYFKFNKMGIKGTAQERK